MAISSKIDKDILGNYYQDFNGLNYEPFFYPCIKKESNTYSLLFSEGIETTSLETTLKDLSLWIEDTHFYIYFENDRYTFDKLEIIEVKLNEGQLSYKTHSIKDIISSSLFLNLRAGGVQQDFNLPIELLMTQDHNWNKEITDFLIAELLSLIEIDLNQINEDGGLFYGAAFNLNYEIDCLRKLNPILQPNMFKSIHSIQTKHRKILVNNLNNKINHPLNKTVSIDDVQQLEMELGIVFPLTFKLIYTTISEGGFGPDFGFLPLTGKVYSIKNVTLLFREQLSVPVYIIPFAYLKKGVYCCLDTRKSSFPVISFYRLKEVKEWYWYNSYVQQTYSFEEWLNNWIEGVFPQIYQISNNKE